MVRVGLAIVLVTLLAAATISDWFIVLKSAMVASPILCRCNRRVVT